MVGAVVNGFLSSKGADERPEPTWGSPSHGAGAAASCGPGLQGRSTRREVLGRIIW